MVLAPFLLPLAGGVLIGLAAGGFNLVTGETVGASGIARGALTGPERGWQLGFLAGLLVAGLAASRFLGTGAVSGLGEQGIPRIMLAGLLVGLGAGVSNGCTSGHGVCGLARLSRRSLVAVFIFMATAGLTVFILHHGLAR